MLQVLVCLPQPEEAKLVFDYTTSVVKDLKTRCEIYCSANYEIIRQKLVDNFYSYDILLLEALDRGCLAIAEFLRSRNFIGSIIFIAKDSAKISNIFIYRPSYLLPNWKTTDRFAVRCSGPIMSRSRHVPISQSKTKMRF